jgi:hypothetical protein
MLSYYDIVISGAHNLEPMIRNPTCNYHPPLYALSNTYIRTSLSKMGFNVIGHNGWSNFPLSIKKIKYATLDARLDFEIARRCSQLVGYNMPKDQLNAST